MKQDLNTNNPIADTYAWLEQAVPISSVDACVQLGCLLEEVAELLTALGLGETSAYRGITDEAARQKSSKHQPTAAYWIEHLQRNLNGYYDRYLLDIHDALADIVVTATSLARQLGGNMANTLAEVNRSNWSKFENGKPVYDGNGKVAKGAHYSAPDLGGFLERFSPSPELVKSIIRDETPTHGEWIEHDPAKNLLPATPVLCLSAYGEVTIELFVLNWHIAWHPLPKTTEALRAKFRICGNPGAADGDDEAEECEIHGGK